MISHHQIVDFFDRTRQLTRNGQAHYDIDQPCRWSYFVIDADRAKLTQAGRYLQQQGYEVVGFLNPRPEDNQQTVLLRFDRVERHTPESLLARNSELYKLAIDFDLDGYDGMDVGAIDGP